MQADPVSLARWSQREVQSLLGSIARYTRFVLFSKFFLVVIGVALLGLIITLPLIDADDESIRVVFANTKKTMNDIKQPKMENPRFQGVDAQNQPYTVTARSAMQLEGNRVQLERIEGDVMLKDHAWVSLSADQGLLDLTAKTLKLRGHVHLYQDTGYEFRSEAADIDLNDKSARGELAVEGQGPAGKLKAKGFEITDNSSHIRFGGPVRMTLYPAGTKKK